MTLGAPRVAALPLALALLALLVLNGCGAGGFGGSTTGQPDTSNKTYVALGDGFASAPYLTADTSGNGCLRSSANYPSMVAKALGVKTFTDVSCFGATTSAITTKSTSPTHRSLAAQLDAVSKNTDLITVGIGIDDNNLLHDMFHICTATPCGSDIPGAPVIKQLTAYADNLTAALQAIEAKAPQAYVEVIGYPQLMPAAGLCAGLPPISDGQLGYANKVLKQLNEQLASSARQAGAVYVDIATLSANNTVCSSDPWVSGFRAQAGKSEAFHPRPAEQTAVTDAVVGLARSR